jgi:hypothetical protein
MKRRSTIINCHHLLHFTHSSGDTQMTDLVELDGDSCQMMSVRVQWAYGRPWAQIVNEKGLIVQQIHMPMELWVEGTSLPFNLIVRMTCPHARFSVDSSYGLDVSNDLCQK